MPAPKPEPEITKTERPSVVARRSVRRHGVPSTVAAALHLAKLARSAGDVRAVRFHERVARLAPRYKATA